MAKILIAEDDRSARDLFSTAIESMGHCAINAENGTMAWSILNVNTDIAFIVSDLSMPEMDGLELIKLIRADDRFSSIPILIVSGAIRAKEIVSLLEHGATWFMAKPVNMIEMMNMINKHFEQA
jgi:two-component system, chemotaxis family, chemotaxis protein CheY